MNPEEKEILQKTNDLAKENNKILKSIRRSNRWSTIFRLFYWLIIIGVSIGAFYFIQPYIDPLINAYKGIQTDINNIKSVTNKIPTSGK